MNNDEYAQRTNSYLIDFIKFADAKAASILTLVGLIAGGLASKFEDIFSVALEICPTSAGIVGLNALWILVYIFLTGQHCLHALRPRRHKTTRPSLNSFPNIAEMPEADYCDAVKSLNSNDIAEHYAAHNWILSVVTKEKYAAVEAAIDSLKIVLGASAAFVTLALMLKVAALLT